MYSLYNITIAGSNSAAPSDGFIDNLTIPMYLQQGAAPPANVAAGLAKARANYRYKLLCQNLSLNTNIYTSNMVGAGGDCNTAPTSFNFTATVEHGDDSLYFYDETANNVVVTDPIASLVRYVARALIASETTEIMYIDPTASTAPGNATASSRIGGSRFQTEMIGAVAANLTAAASMITITKIA